MVWSMHAVYHRRLAVRTSLCCWRLRAVLGLMGAAWCCAQAGVSTDEIDKAVHKMIIENGAYPSPLTYGKPLLASTRILIVAHTWHLADFGV